MKKLLDTSELILMEAAIVEQLRRSSGIQLHDTLVNAPLIYQSKGREALARLYEDYLTVAREAGVPFLMCTPTWRANHERVSGSNVESSVNVDAALFMRNLRDATSSRTSSVRVGGMIGCKNDCYLPAEGLGASESETFHAWQVDQLAQGGVDFLIAETLPCVEEAVGMARAMEQTRLPYLISFVIDRRGLVLDGSPLMDAARRIDSATSRNPVGYMVNCAYPDFLCAGDQPAELFTRLVGYQANASSLDHCDLDNAVDLAAEDVTDWGDAMVALNRSHGVTILGGCCGTGVEHLRYIANAFKG